MGQRRLTKIKHEMRHNGALRIPLQRLRAPVAVHIHELGTRGVLAAPTRAAACSDPAAGAAPECSEKTAVLRYAHASWKSSSFGI